MAKVIALLLLLLLLASILARSGGLGLWKRRKICDRGTSGVKTEEKWESIGRPLLKIAFWDFHRWLGDGWTKSQKNGQAFLSPSFLVTWHVFRLWKWNRRNTLLFSDNIFHFNCLLQHLVLANISSPPPPPLINIETARVRVSSTEEEESSPFKVHYPSPPHLTLPNLCEKDIWEWLELAEEMSEEQ